MDLVLMDCDPVTESWVEDTYVVWTTVEPQLTLAPFTNPVPVTVRVKLAGDWKLSGVTITMCGIGLSMMTELVPEALAFVLLTARMVTEFGVGIIAGD